ncbi:GNAT superfamily N-acetyltransferase [Salibacterium salarium]|uniref:N-acetyltransferase n=1 Tax=Salibacterium salarium TaxID=284579 RepID=UPI00278AC6D1|nr:N-acetyltransferase [Salibacterium salarium]MDQ0299030.1 GNAT superfamily N-acetyltransferase [Salibacterium salarium]
MSKQDVKRLLVNYKTLEEFQNFKEIGVQELSMKEELEENIIENDSESPFYGIYYGDRLVARMCLYKIDSKFDFYFDPPQNYLELWKLEVLEPYRKLGFGETLVNYAKSFNLPVKTNARQRSDYFWEKMNFESVTYNPDRDRGENPYVWYPEGVQAQKQSGTESSLAPE